MNRKKVIARKKARSRAKNDVQSRFVYCGKILSLNNNFVEKYKFAFRLICSSVCTALILSADIAV